jgi:hypothetical protein
MKASMLDTQALTEMLRQLEGKRLVVVVDCGDCCELAFEDDGGPNLVTIYSGEGRGRGTVALGGISGELLDSGYGRWAA